MPPRCPRDYQKTKYQAGTHTSPRGADATYEGEGGRDRGASRPPPKIKNDKQNKEGIFPCPYFLVAFYFFWLRLGPRLYFLVVSYLFGCPRILFGCPPYFLVAPYFFGRPGIFVGTPAQPLIFLVAPDFLVVPYFVGRSLFFGCIWRPRIFCLFRYFLVTTRPYFLVVPYFFGWVPYFWGLRSLFFRLRSLFFGRSLFFWVAFGAPVFCWLRSLFLLGTTRPYFFGCVGDLKEQKTLQIAATIGFGGLKKQKTP